MPEKISAKRKIKCAFFKSVASAAALIVGIMLLCLIGYILYRGIPNINLKLLTSKPSLINDTIGILPNILNTIYTILIALVIVIPLGIGAAVYLNEYAKTKNLFV